jgi:ACT domain-containing protein
MEWLDRILRLMPGQCKKVIHPISKFETDLI